MAENDMIKREEGESLESFHKRVRGSVGVKVLLTADDLGLIRKLQGADSECPPATAKGIKYMIQLVQGAWDNLKFRAANEPDNEELQAAVTSVREYIVLEK